MSGGWMRGLEEEIDAVPFGERLVDKETVGTEVAEILTALGYQEQEGDRAVRELAVNIALHKLTAAINLPAKSAMPGGLFPTAALMAAGETLFLLRTSGKLTGFDAGAAVKSVRLGDTDVTFATGDEGAPEQQFQRLVDAMREPGEGELARYRKICW